MNNKKLNDSGFRMEGLGHRQCQLLEEVAGAGTLESNPIPGENYDLIYLVATNHNIVGDGITDNSVSIQSLINDGQTVGRTVFFPKGVYIFSNIELVGGIHILGEAGTVFKITNIGDKLFNAGSIDNVTFENIIFDGGGSTNRPTTEGTQSGITLSGTKRFLFSNCMFKGFSKDGLYVTQQGYTAGGQYSYNLFIHNCRFEQSYRGVHFGARAEYANVTGTTFGQNRIGAFVGGGNNQFASCQFNNNYDGMIEVGGNTDGINYPNNSHNSFTGCQFNHNGSHSVLLENVEVGIMFTGCQFFDGTMEFRGSTKGVIFSACEGGTWRHTSNQSGTVLFTNCYFFTEPTITNNTNTKYIDNIRNGILERKDFVEEYGDNNFTGSNDFSRTPTVSKTTKLAESIGVATSTADSNLYSDLSVITPANTQIDSLKVAIRGSVPGDTVRATVYSINMDTNKLEELICSHKESAVTSKQLNGMNVIEVSINKQYPFETAFAVAIERITVDGRVIGQAYNSGSNSWHTLISNGLPSVGTSVSQTGSLQFHTATYTETKADVATVSNVKDLCTIGEYKELAYNNGISFTNIAGTWLRCNGQKVSIADYSELFSKIGTKSGKDDGKTTFKLPNRRGKHIYVYAK